VALAVAALVAVAGLGAMASPAAHAAPAAVTCTKITPEFSGMTAALINPTSIVTGEVDATGCDVGVYFGPGHKGAVDGANIHGAIAFGVVVDSAKVTISNSQVHDILGAPGSDEGDCGDEEEGGSCGGDEATLIATAAGNEQREYIGSKHGTGILVTGPSAQASIYGNSVSAYGRRGISVSGSGVWASITGNTITGLGTGDATHKMGQSGVWIANSANAVVSGNLIRNNEIVGSGPASNAVMVAGGPYHNGQKYTLGIRINDNELLNNVTGVLLTNLTAAGTAPPPVTDNRVTNNTITASPYSATSAKPSAGVFVAGGKRDMVTGNTFSGYSTLQAAIKISPTGTRDILVSGNTLS
jgi:hypothetical protein